MGWLSGSLGRSWTHQSCSLRMLSSVCITAHPNALQWSAGSSPWWCRWPSSPQDLLHDSGLRYAAAPRLILKHLGRNQSALNQPKSRIWQATATLQNACFAGAVPGLPAYFWSPTSFWFHPGEDFMLGTGNSCHSVFCTDLHPSPAVLFCNFFSHVIAA